MTCRDLLYISFREARILLRPQAQSSDNELQDGLIFLNQQINYWAARDCYAWTSEFNEYSLTPGHQPHEIGPGLAPPDFASTLRPTRILSASIVLNTSNPNTDVPIAIRDNQWWANQRVKDIQSNIPTDLWYETAIPNGKIWLWPVPNFPYPVRIENNVVLQEFTSLDQAFIAPQAYRAAVSLTLAEELSDVWGTPMPPNLQRRALKARDALQSNNNLAPRISTADYGTSGCNGGDFNYMTGTIPSEKP